jgi:hypothetical protein
MASKKDGKKERQRDGKKGIDRNKDRRQKSKRIEIERRK